MVFLDTTATPPTPTSHPHPGPRLVRTTLLPSTPSTCPLRDDQRMPPFPGSHQATCGPWAVARGPWPAGKPDRRAGTLDTGSPVRVEAGSCVFPRLSPSSSLGGRLGLGVARAGCGSPGPRCSHRVETFPVGGGRDRRGLPSWRRTFRAEGRTGVPVTGARRESVGTPGPTPGRVAAPKGAGRGHLCPHKPGPAPPPSRTPGCPRGPASSPRAQGPLWSLPCGHANGRGSDPPALHTHAHTCAHICMCACTRLSLPPSVSCFSAEITGHHWAHKIKYLKDVGNLSWFLWQHKNNSHFPANLRENTFFFASWAANYF